MNEVDRLLIPGTVHCRWRDPAAGDDGRAHHCGNLAVDISYDSGAGTVIDALCEQHRPRGLARVEIDGRARTAAHALLVGAVAGAAGVEDPRAEAAVEALFGTQSIRQIVRRHLSEREHLA